MVLSDPGGNCQCWPKELVGSLWFQIESVLLVQNPRREGNQGQAGRSASFLHAVGPPMQSILLPWTLVLGYLTLDDMVTRVLFSSLPFPVEGRKVRIEAYFILTSYPVSHSVHRASPRMCKHFEISRRCASNRLPSHPRGARSTHPNQEQGNQKKIGKQQTTGFQAKGGPGPFFEQCREWKPEQGLGRVFAPTKTPAHFGKCPIKRNGGAPPPKSSPQLPGYRGVRNPQDLGSPCAPAATRHRLADLAPAAVRDQASAQCNTPLPSKP